MEESDEVRIPRAVLSKWAESCLHINHHGTLVQRELKPSLENARAIDLVERGRVRASKLFNELVEYGAAKPAGYTEPDPKD